MNVFITLRKNSPEKYPERLGEVWTDAEIMQLLISIRKKKWIKDIAAEHQRTTGGINAQRKKMAAQYWFNDNRSIEDIEKFTGLSKTQIERTIKRLTEKAQADITQDSKEDICDLSEIREFMSRSKEEICDLKSEIMRMKKNLSEIREFMSRSKKGHLANVYLS